MALLSLAKDGATLTIRLQPGASANRIVGIVADKSGDSLLKVMVTASPEKGKANAALIKLLSKHWEIPKSDISIIKGMTERRKVIHIAGKFDTLALFLNKKLEELHG